LSPGSRLATAMNDGIVLTAEDHATVMAILERTLPPGCKAFVYGSRATGKRVKPWSDLDLAIEGADRLPWNLPAQLKEEFSEALLDWKVDVVDLKAISPEFRRMIEPDLVALS
jgi:predicted nucleotidyltransferase